MTYPNMRKVEIKNGNLRAVVPFSTYKKVWKNEGWSLVNQADSRTPKVEHEVFEGQEPPERELDVFKGGLPSEDDGSDTKATKKPAEKKEGSK